VIVAGERNRLEDLRFIEVRGECRPGVLCDRALVDQIVDQRDQRLLRCGPACGIRRAGHRGGDLGFAEADLGGKEGDVDAHSYSQPSRAVVRSITISRWRRLSGPLSSRPPANILSKTRGLRAMVRNNASGSTPGGMMRFRALAMAGW